MNLLLRFHDLAGGRILIDGQDITQVTQASLYRLMEGKTVVAIAHRLSTIATMGRLVVMDAGRIVEQGDHASLLAAGGLYARLWAHQSGGFLGEPVEDTEQNTPARRGALAPMRE